MYEAPFQGNSEPRSLSVQSYACTVGVSADWTVIVASDNCEEILGISAQVMLGKPVNSVFGHRQVHRMRSQAQLLSEESRVLHLQGCQDFGRDNIFDITVTGVGASVYFEFEIAELAPGLATGLEQIQRMVQRVAHRNEIADAATVAARTLQVLTGFDRVTVHRSSAVGFGQALGWETSASLPGEPSLKCIQAHAESAVAVLHYVPDLDVDTTPLRILDDDIVEGVPDVARLCSFSPDTQLREALQEEGVRAAMTIPIWISGDLWGLFICHNTTPMTQTVGRRSALTLFALLFGYEVKLLYERAGALGRNNARSVRDQILEKLESQMSFPEAVLQAQDEINAFLPHDGMALWHLGAFSRKGVALPSTEVEGLLSYMQSPDIGEVITIDRLSDIGVTSDKLDPHCTAAMAIPISLIARDYLLLFRRVDPENDQVKNWLAWEIDTGNALRSALIETHLRAIEKMAATSTSADEQNSVLIAELNHRVRNTLNLIRGMISQGQSKLVNVESYAGELEARVYSLTRAYEQLTKSDWGWASLTSALDLGVSEYVRPERPNVLTNIADIDLTPTAFTTMALVLHELLTNAQKFGALSVPNGQVSLSVELRPDNYAVMRWVESGGPTVAPPEQHGFGLTIIEQTVPFELRGSADVQFQPDGLVAEFLLPPAHLRPHVLRKKAANRVTVSMPKPDLSGVSIEGDALIVEDSLIIAIDAADLLRDAGASRVFSCNSVESSMKTLSEQEISFAMIDVNLGSESSLEVAKTIWERGIPAVLATGYGRDQVALKKFPPMPLLTKPYSVGDLKQVISSLRKEEQTAGA